MRPFRDQTVRYCSACGTGHVVNGSVLLRNYYEHDYAASNRGDREVAPEIYFSESYRHNTPSLGRYYLRAQRQIVLLRKFHAQFSDVLDFGSGPGYFLHLSEAERKFAFELDSQSKKYLDYIGAHRLERLTDFRPGMFDTIVASHTVEHLVAEELISTLSLLIRTLKPDGRMLIEVPNGGHTYLNLTGRQDPHTLFFTPEGLYRAVELAEGKILYAGSMSKTPIERRKTPLYEPEGLAFFKVASGSLTIVCGRRP